MNGTDSLDDRFDMLQRRAIRAGAAGLALWLLFVLIGLFSAGVLRVALGAYLIGYLYVLGITLGCLIIVMIHHVAGGGWGRAIRRVLEAGTRMVPVMALLFIPVLLGVKSLYTWSHADVLAGDELLQHKRPYLNVGFFVARAAIYFATWSLLAFFLNRWSARQERAALIEPPRRFRVLSGPGLVIYGLMMTFAAVDWAMSLEPHWFSTIYGVIFMVGQAANGLAFGTAATLLVARWRRPSIEIAQQTLADLGSLMLAFVMLWAYIALSQLLIMWSGNLPEEIPWYLTRMHGGWGFMGLLLIVFHFFVPFGLLLVARVKREPRLLIGLAALILVMRALDLIWIVAPSFSTEGHHGGAWVALLTPVALVGIGGVWLTLFIQQLRSRSLLPYPAPTNDGPQPAAEAAS